jgi:hypothetical protein
MYQVLALKSDEGQTLSLAADFFACMPMMQLCGCRSFSATVHGTNIFLPDVVHPPFSSLYRLDPNRKVRIHDSAYSSCQW